MLRSGMQHFLLVGVVLAFCALELGACGGPEEAKTRTLPDVTRKLEPGTYRSEQFEPPFSFGVGEGWTSVPPKTSEHLHLRWEETGGIGFLKLREVYEPTRTGRPNVVEAPRDLVAWFGEHPYLETSEPRPATVAGVEGERFDVSFGDLPEGHRGKCGTDCVDLGRVGSGVPPLFFPEGGKARVIVLEDVRGETVTIASNSPATDFDEFAPEAQKVIDSVEWRSS